MSVTDEDRLARAALSRLGEPGSPSLTHAVGEHGPVFVLEHLRQEGHGADLAERIATTDPSRDLAQAARQGVRFVVPGDDEWPTQLDDLAFAPHLHERGGVPVGLWCRGPLRLDEATERAVAVVGSRSATTYGATLATDLAATVADNGWSVVSGAAFGIDQAAHRGALLRRGPTLAVLACGADRAYPKAHTDLIDYIAQVGLVVSEAPPGCAPTRVRFLARNRLIAGLSRGTVVVEAAIRSGALNTASWTAGLGRLVMGVPGPVTSAPSAGVHQLIRSRDALLVTSGEEVLEAVSPIGTHVVADPREEPRARDRLTAQERQVLDAVPVVAAVESSKIANSAGIARTRTEAALASLHRAGLVECELGRWRLRGEEGPAA